MSPETKNKLKLAFLLLITALPVTLATMSFKSADGNDKVAATSNKGQLINPPADISALDMRDAEGNPAFRSFEDEIATLSDNEEYEIKPWVMLFVTARQCEAACKERIHYLQQLHVALGKNIQRVRRYYLDTSGAPLDQNIATYFREEFPSMGIAYSDTATVENNMRDAGAQLSLRDQDYVLFIDPVGNVMMYYTEDKSAEDIMSDLETLLKYSSLG